MLNNPSTNTEIYKESQTVTNEMVIPRITSQAYFSQVPLAAGEKSSTGWIDLTFFDSFSFFFNSDKDGKYTIEYSNDKNLLVTPVIQVEFVAANGRRKGALDPDASFVRIEFTNTSSQPQTMFTMSIWAKVGLTQASLETLSGKGAATRLAQWVKSVLQLPNDLGLYDDIYRVNNALLVHIENLPEGTDTTKLAKETTLASILSKLISAPATEAKQDAGNTFLNAIAGKDFATQTTLASILTILANGNQKTAVTNNDYAKESGGTLAAILAKIIPSAATEGKQDSANVLLTAIRDKLIVSPATEATLVSILNKLSSDPSTATKQEAGNVILSAIRDKLITGPATEVTLAAILSKLSGTLQVASVPTSTGGYPNKGVYQPTGTGGNFTVISAGVKRLGALNINNTSTGPITLLVYDKATAPVAADTPVHSFVIPGGSSLPANLGEGLHFNNGIAFGAMGGDSGLLNIVASLLNAITAGKFTVNYAFN